MTRYNSDGSRRAYVGFDTTVEQAAELRKRAAAEGRPLANFLRHALDKVIQDEDRKGRTK